MDFFNDFQKWHPDRARPWRDIVLIKVCVHQRWTTWNKRHPANDLKIILDNQVIIHERKDYLTIIPAFQCIKQDCILTVILSSWSVTWMLFLFQEMVGSGWPLGGMHSMTAGSPAATTTSLGVWRKSSLRTTKKNNNKKKGAQYEIRRTKDICTFTSVCQRSVAI